VKDYAPLNYTESKPGETFVKIGIGLLTGVGAASDAAALLLSFKQETSEVNYL
jgi:hypothetical protein